MKPISLSVLRRVVVLGQLRQVFAVLGVDRLRRGAREVGHVPVAARPVEQREVALEPAGGRDQVGGLAQVPLAHHVGVIAGVLEQLRQRRDPLVEVALVAGHAPLVRRRPLVHVAKAVDVRVHAAQQDGSRGRATGVRVEAGEPDTVVRERVEVWRLDLAAERAHVGEPQVVAQDDDDVGPAGRPLGKRGGRPDQGAQHPDDARGHRDPPVQNTGLPGTGRTRPRWRGVRRRRLCMLIHQHSPSMVPIPVLSKRGLRRARADRAGHHPCRLQ